MTFPTKRCDPCDGTGKQPWTSPPHRGDPRFAYNCSRCNGTGITKDTISYVTAAALMEQGMATLADDQVLQCYDAHASMISYHHADDSGREWGEVEKYRPGLTVARTELEARGLPVPAGYLL